MSQADICFSFSPKASLRKWFLKGRKETCLLEEDSCGVGEYNGPHRGTPEPSGRRRMALSWRGPLVLSVLCQRRSQGLGGGRRVGCSGRSLVAGGEGQGAWEKGDELLGAARPARWPLAQSPLGPDGWASARSSAGCGEAPSPTRSIWSWEP